MKMLTGVILRIFTVFSGFAFLVLAILAAFFSGAVEYEVLKQFLTFPKSVGLDVDPSAWAAVLVFVLEGSKLTLHYYGAALGKREVQNQISEVDTVKLRKKITLLKNGLLAFSLMCSLIFFTNTLYGNSPEAEKAKEKWAIECDNKLKEGSAQLLITKNENIAAKMSSYSTEEDDIAKLKTKIARTEAMHRKTEDDQKREDLAEQLDILRTQLKEKEDYLRPIKERISNEEELVYNTALQTLEEKYGENGTERTAVKDGAFLAEGDNQVLRIFLETFRKNTIGGSYSRAEYFILSLIISFGISLALEGCIYIGETLLTISESSFNKIIGEFKPLEKGKRAVNIIIWFSFSVMIALAGYLLVGMFLPMEHNAFDIKTALLTYAATTIFVNVINIKPLKDSVEMPKSRLTSLLNKSVDAIFSAVIPGVLAFVVFVLIGMITEGNTMYSDLNAIAIAIGGVLVKGTSFSNCDFLQE